MPSTPVSATSSFLIRRDIEEAFRERIGNEVERHTDVTYVFQDLDNVPAGFAIPDGRSKPWGTGHAVLCCKDAVHGNFAAINADDFYGTTAFAALAEYLRTAADTPAGYAYSMVGYVLRNTLSEHGHVARGVCQVDADGYLTGIQERLHIEPLPEGIMDRMEDGSLVPFAADSTVSMNMWGFTPSLFGELEARFPHFLAQSVPANPLKAEFLLPDIVGDLVQEAEGPGQGAADGRKMVRRHLPGRPPARPGRGPRADRPGTVPGAAVGGVGRG